MASSGSGRENRSSLRRMAETEVAALLHIAQGLSAEAKVAASKQAAAAAQRVAELEATPLYGYVRGLTDRVLRLVLEGAVGVAQAQSSGRGGSEGGSAAPANLSTGALQPGVLQGTHDACWAAVREWYVAFAQEMEERFTKLATHNVIMHSRKVALERDPSLRALVHPQTLQLRANLTKDQLASVNTNYTKLLSVALAETPPPPSPEVCPAAQLAHNMPGSAPAGSALDMFRRVTLRRMVEVVEYHRAKVVPAWRRLETDREALHAAYKSNKQYNVVADMTAVLQTAKGEVDRLLPTTTPAPLVSSAAEPLLGVGSASGPGVLPSSTTEQEHLAQHAEASFLAPGRALGGVKRGRSKAGANPHRVRLEHVAEWLADHQRFPGARAALGEAVDRLQEEVDAATLDAQAEWTQQADLRRAVTASDEPAAKAARA